MKKKVGNLKEGDVFIHKDIIYEVIEKGKWFATVQYPNDKAHISYNPPYLHCKFSNYTQVEV